MERQLRKEEKNKKIIVSPMALTKDVYKRQQIKEQKNLISQREYELEQLERQYQQDMLDLEEWKKKANEERNAKINQLENEKRKMCIRDRASFFRTISR